MRLTLCLASCIIWFASQTLAFAQNTTWEENIEAALNAPYPNDRIVALTKLYETETNFQNKIETAYYISNISRELKLYEQAASYAEIGMSLSKKHFAGNLLQQDIINTLLVDIYFRSGKKDKAVETIDKHLKVNDANLDLVWSQQNKGILHRYSGLYCPNNINDLYREESHIFHPVGIDVGCSYKVYNGEDNAVTVYLTRQNEDGDSRSSHEKAMAAVLLNWGGSDFITQDIKLETQNITDTDITETLLRSGSIQKGFSYTGTWTGDVMGWTLKSRITWSEPLKESFGRTHALRLLEASTKNIVSHLDKCANINETEFLGTKHKKSSVIALSLAALAANDELNEVKAFIRPDKACLRTTSLEGNAAAEFYDSKTKPFAIVGTAVRVSVYLTKAPELNALLDTTKEQYFLREVGVNEDGKNSVRIISAYDGLPSSVAIMTDFADMISGKEDLIGEYVVEDAENSTINIYVEPTDEN